MTNELHWLVLTILLTAVLWMPYIINRLFEGGILHGIWDPDGETTSNVPWAQRLMDAHINAVENLAVFAPLIIITHILEMNTELTATAAILYFYARLAHAVLFTFRVPVLRIVAFLAGIQARFISLIMREIGNIFRQET
ncbi:MAG: MAPEG family protein [Cocleimonas sp.]